MDAPVNIDELKIRLLILCKSKNKFESVANYLIRRGWETTISETIKDAFKTIAVFKPDFVLVSVSTPTSKVAQLPMVIAQTFKTNTVLFSEAADVKSMKALQTIEAQYKISGSASGPSVHRRIKQILQEIHNPKAATGPREAHNAKGDDSGAMVIKGSSVNADNPAIHPDGGVIIQKNAAIAGGNFLRSGSIMQEGEKGQNPTPQFHSGTPEDFMALAEQFQESESIAPNENDEREGESERGAEGSALDRASEESARGRSSASLRENNSHEHVQPPPTGSAELAPEQTQKKSSTQKYKSHEGMGVHENPMGLPKTSATGIFDKIIHVARACVLPQQAQATKIEAFGDCMIIPILTPGANTYVVLASLGAIEEEIQFSTTFLSRLKTELCGEYPGVQIGDDQRIEFETIETSAAIENEAGNFRLKNGSGEVLIKLLREVNYDPRIIAAGVDARVEVDPKDLVPNAAVGVEVFLYLKRNDRYYLYLKPRSRISEKQKGRLIGGGSKLFINKNETDTYRAIFRKNKTLETFYDQSKRQKVAA